MPDLPERADYAELLAELKTRISTAQVRVDVALNAKLVAIHWPIGRVLNERVQAAGWGWRASVV